MPALWFIAGFVMTTIAVVVTEYIKDYFNILLREYKTENLCNLGAI